MRASLTNSAQNLYLFYHHIVAESIEIAEKTTLLIESAYFGSSYYLQSVLCLMDPDFLSMIKLLFSAWEKRMAEAEPCGPFRNFYSSGGSQSTAICFICLT